MAEVDDAARMLARYRAARRAPPDLREVVRERLAASLHAEVPVASRSSGRRGLVIAAAVLAAAGAVLVLSQSLGDTVAVARRDAHEQADYSNEDGRAHGDAREHGGVRDNAIAPAELPALPPSSALVSAAPTPQPSDAPVRPRTATDSPRATPPSTALAEELAGLEAIRTQLAGGDGEAALAAIARHRAAFPAGQLVPEREALTIEALCAAGDTTAAVRRARAFTLGHPDSTALAQLPSRCR